MGRPGLGRGRRARGWHRAARCRGRARRGRLGGRAGRRRCARDAGLRATPGEPLRRQRAVRRRRADHDRRRGRRTSSRTRSTTRRRSRRVPTAMPAAPAVFLARKAQSPASPSAAHPGAPDRATVESRSSRGTSPPRRARRVDLDVRRDRRRLRRRRRARTSTSAVTDDRPGSCSTTAADFADHEAIRFPARTATAARPWTSTGAACRTSTASSARRADPGSRPTSCGSTPGRERPTEVAMAAGVLDATGRGRTTTFLRSGGREVELVVANSPVRVDGLPSVGRTWQTTRRWLVRVTRSAPASPPASAGSTCRPSDYDRDRRDDLLLVTGGLQAPMAEGTRIYRNTSSGLHDVYSTTRRRSHRRGRRAARRPRRRPAPGPRPALADAAARQPPAQGRLPHRIRASPDERTGARRRRRRRGRPRGPLHRPRRERPQPRRRPAAQPQARPVVRVGRDPPDTHRRRRRRGRDRP